MSRQFSLMRLQGTASVLALSTAAVIASSAVQPAKAQTDGIFAGGSSLVSLAMRQIMNCYGTPLPPDEPPLAECPVSPDVQGQYAAVGSGSGFRGFISNDPHQLFLGNPGPTISMPAKPPVYVDEGGGPFYTYPYPNVDFGASDSPLSSAAAPVTTSFVTFSPATNWVTTTTTFTPVTATGSVTTTYATAAFGAPIQLPLIEAVVAVAINTNTMTVRSASSTPSNAGGAIQLTTAQLCAIFSGAVTDWNSTANISFINNVGTKGTQTFHAANIGALGALAQYSTASLPIKVVYRSDGSGTSFIITNYLKSVCPQLDDGSNKYAQIFTGSLPSNSFTQLIANINAAFPGAGRTTNWIATDGSQNVAQAINNSSGGATFNGRIGYLSADFTQPYLDASVASYSPLSASVQNEALRVAGTYLPAATSGGSNPPTFIRPTPAGADLSFASLTTPAAGATHNDWNLYSQVWPTTTTSGGVNISGLSKLGIPTATGAYPIVGTAFAGLYSCYRADGGTIARATRIKDFLSWYYVADVGLVPSTARKVLEANGFGALPTALRAAALTKAGTIAAAGTGTCASMSGG